VQLPPKKIAAPILKVYTFKINNDLLVASSLEILEQIGILACFYCLFPEG